MRGRGNHNSNKGQKPFPNESTWCILLMAKQLHVEVDRSEASSTRREETELQNSRIREKKTRCVRGLILITMLFAHRFAASRLLTARWPVTAIGDSASRCEKRIIAFLLDYYAVTFQQGYTAIGRTYRTHPLAFFKYFKEAYALCLLTRLVPRTLFTRTFFSFLTHFTKCSFPSTSRSL